MKTRNVSSCLLRLHHAAAALRVLVAALVLPLGGLGRANDGPQLQVIRASGAGFGVVLLRRLPTFWGRASSLFVPACGENT